MPLVSVIIPCYNSGSFIKTTLTALEKQTFQDFDVILADDCSADNTAQVISEYASHSKFKIIYTRNSQNSGPAVSRNNAIQLSDAKYICFCDSDDWYDEDYLSNMVAAAQAHCADMVFCGYRVVFADGKPPLERPHPCETNELSKEEALLFNVDSLCCLMVKREIATSFPLPDLRNGEDMAVIPVWMMHASKFFVISQPMYNYLLRKGSLSNNATSKVVNALLHSFSYICQNALTAHMHQVTYIGVRNVLYGALLNLFKCSNDRAWANCIVDDFEKEFPFWTKNPYLNRLPLFKRVFVKFVSKRKFRIVRLMCLGHQWLTER